MLYGEVAETGDPLELPDNEYENLLEFFHYMYSNEVNLTRVYLMGVLYFAKKYMVLLLNEKCTKYLLDSLDP